MPDALDMLCDRVRVIRERREDVRCASIAFVPDENTACSGPYRARVRVDGRSVGGLDGPKAATVRVEPGTHAIKVRFSPRSGVNSKSGVVVTRSLTLEEGDDVTLVCGMDQEAMRDWSACHRQVARIMLVWAIGICATMAVAWFAYPFLREVVAECVIRYQWTGAAMRLAFWAVESRIMMVGLVVLGWVALGAILGLGLRRTEVDLKSRQTAIFFVEARP